MESKSVCFRVSNDTLPPALSGKSWNMDEHLQIFFNWIDFFGAFCPLNHDNERNDGIWTHILVDDTWSWLLQEYNRWIFTIARYTTVSSPPNVDGIFAVDRGATLPETNIAPENGGFQ